MNREEGRAERKLRKRRLRWLERECKRVKAMDKFVTELEENFEDDEIEAAKVFSVDYITHGGSFAELGETFSDEDLEKVARNYGLEPADGEFILNTVEDIFEEEEKSSGRSN